MSSNETIIDLENLRTYSPIINPHQERGLYIFFEIIKPYIWHLDVINYSLRLVSITNYREPS